MTNALRIGPYPVPITDARGRGFAAGDTLGCCHLRIRLGWRLSEEEWPLGEGVIQRFRELWPDLEPPPMMFGIVGRHPTGLLAMVSASRELDDQDWLHVSISRMDRLPDYADLKCAKEGIIGAERKAIQVFAAASEHINDHEHCLHLWSPLGNDPLPDFTRGNGTI